DLAKPILDKYGYKGSFFTVCTYVNLGSAGADKSRMTWQDLQTLQQQGHDIESHTMTHTDLNAKSQQNLNYEIGGSRQCLLNHGINSTVFAYPASTGGYNSTVVNTVAKYYNLARVGDAPLAFLHCNGYKKDENSNCLPYNKDGTLKYENRYDIRNWSDRPKIEQSSPTAATNNQAPASFNNMQMFGQFIKDVNLQSLYNKNGCIQAIPIVVYHNFLVDNNHVYLSTDSFTDTNLFEYEMKYLHDNGFVVLKMSNLGFNPVNNHLFIKGPIVINTNNPSSISNVLLKNC
ncbi:MAG TPA: polysaccharide deacetylase family protein, partial [Candidatus Nitrosocosmicus sp.]|nr:polysaccharide deacetylase family protein [Candidatus Nitrosocosmicus sp.]